MNEPSTPYIDRTHFIDPRAWQSFAAAFAQTLAKTARAYQATLQRSDRDLD